MLLGCLVQDPCTCGPFHWRDFLRVRDLPDQTHPLQRKGTRLSRRLSAGRSARLDSIPFGDGESTPSRRRFTGGDRSVPLAVCVKFLSALGPGGMSRCPAPALQRERTERFITRRRRWNRGACLVSRTPQPDPPGGGGHNAGTPLAIEARPFCRLSPASTRVPLRPRDRGTTA